MDEQLDDLCPWNAIDSKGYAVGFQPCFRDFDIANSESKMMASTNESLWEPTMSRQVGVLCRVAREGKRLRSVSFDNVKLHSPRYFKPRSTKWEIWALQLSQAQDHAIKMAESFHVGSFTGYVIYSLNIHR